MLLIYLLAANLAKQARAFYVQRCQSTRQGTFQCHPPEMAVPDHCKMLTGMELSS